jgi:multimeric flavodoxin WrbA
MSMAMSLLIVYYSATGGSAAMAQAAYAGALTEADCAARLLRAQDAGAAHMRASDGYLFVFPENLAAIAGEMKAFFDRCYYPLLGQIAGRPYAAMVCAGSDGQSAAAQVERIATGWRLRRVADTMIICTHAQSTEAILAPKVIAAADLARCREVGAMLASGLALGVY